MKHDVKVVHDDPCSLQSIVIATQLTDMGNFCELYLH